MSPPKNKGVSAVSVMPALTLNLSHPAPNADRFDVPAPCPWYFVPFAPRMINTKRKDPKDR
jgi:hypothetical protein